MKRTSDANDDLCPIKVKKSRIEMKIDQLPTEMLMKIFSFLPTYGNASLVNKLFYGVACKVYDSHICLTVDESFLKRDWLPSIINSTRKISKVEIVYNFDDEPAIIAIVKKFSTSIKYFRFVGQSASESQVMEILSLVPNVKELALVHLQRLRSENTPSLDEVSRNGDLNLHQLKKLYLSSCSPDILFVLHRLPMGVLQDLNIRCVNLDAMTVLFKRQTNIEKLILTLHLVDDIDMNEDTIAHIFDNLKLESLELCCTLLCKNVNAAKVLSKQTKLKSLKLHFVEVDQQFMNFVANHMPELETFSMENCKTPIVACIAEIAKLKTLKDLSFCHLNIEQLELLVTLHIPTITTLTLTDYKEYSGSIIRALAKNVPNLKVFKFHQPGQPRIPLETFNAVMRHFNFVEVLGIRTYELCRENDFSQLTGEDCFNPKLTELIFESSRTLLFLDKLIAFYPNLKKFRSSDSRVFSSMQFRRILDGFTSLESLLLDGSACSLTMDDLNYLIEHRNNLKFVSLNGLNYSPDELKRLFRAAFDVVIYEHRGRSMWRMAVDRNTMNNERRRKDNSTNF